LYQVAAKFVQGNNQGLFISEAISCYEQSLLLDSTNLSVKVNLATCFVEGTSEPMKGIMMLREVLARDSTNIEAHVSLGIFAIQSGQFDKAVDRFKKVLILKPDYIEAYIYLGQAYASMGKKDKAVEALETYKNLNKDETINTEINNYINGLKNS
jgi:cytochrome c-type biogenesis protein CcmH/NrfG